MKYDKRKINVKEIVDHSTGEVIRHESKFIKHVDSDEFIRVYLEDMASFMKISSGMEFKILFLLWSKTKWNNEPMIIDKIVKEDFSKELDIKVQSISDALTRLVKKDILIKNARMRYSLNPKFFFKGDEKAREEVLSINIQYNIKK